MKIAYVTEYDPHDMANWSGLGTHILMALQGDRRVAVEAWGPLRKPLVPLHKLRKLAVQLLTGKHCLSERETSLGRHLAREIARNLRRRGADVVFAPGTVPLSGLDGHVPFAFWTDATFEGMLGFYDAFSNLSERSLRLGRAAERRVMERCSLAVFASDWAARSAREHHPSAAGKIHVVPFGANLEPSGTEADTLARIDARPDGVCRLLFVGVDWARKGGEVALETAAALNAMGIPTELNLVGGGAPARVGALPFVRDFGFLAKGRDRATLERLFGESHFLIMPSRAECFGVVFCEASAFGLPSLASDVGGIPTAVRDGVNGHCFPLSAGAAPYVETIARLVRDRDAYRSLCRRSLEEHRARLNWKTSGRTVVDLLRRLPP